MELAFFVVDVGVSVSDYRSLTELEKLLIKKRHQQKFISEATWQRNAFLNAYSNANRGKNKRFVDLFPKNQPMADKDYNFKAIETIESMEQENGKGWVAKIFKANGMKEPITERKE